jgi:hypothetical protein
MPPRSAFDEKQSGLSGYSQHSSAGILPATLQVPKPLTEQHDEQQPVRKKVYFSHRIRTRPTLHVRDYTKEEIVATWFSKTDFENIKADMRFALGWLRAGILDQDTISYCRRGLECRTKEGTRKRMFNKASTRNAVLNEQDRQLDIFVTDLEAIAKIYIAASRLSQVSARTMGLFDEKEARQP